jgi:hypothetical protein
MKTNINPYGACIGSSSENWKNTREDFEQRVRQEPIRYVLMAAAAGYILPIVPFRSLLVLVFRLFLMLVRPALFLFGVFALAKDISIARIGKASLGDI